jgi:hypothetical protein
MLVVYDSDRPVAHARATPTWAETHRFWITLMTVYAADCERHGVDNLEPSELRYRRSYVSGFMSDLIRARSCEERERIIAEATQFLQQQERKARPEPAPMRVVNSKARPALR